MIVHWGIFKQSWLLLKYLEDRFPRRHFNGQKVVKRTIEP